MPRNQEVSGPWRGWGAVCRMRRRGSAPALPWGIGVLLRPHCLQPHWCGSTLGFPQGQGQSAIGSHHLPAASDTTIPVGTAEPWLMRNGDLLQTGRQDQFGRNMFPFSRNCISPSQVSPFLIRLTLLGTFPRGKAGRSRVSGAGKLRLISMRDFFFNSILDCIICHLALDYNAGVLVFFNVHLICKSVW